MQIRIVERFSSGSNALREYVQRKLQGLNRYFDKIISLDVILSVEKERHRVEILGHLVNRKIVKAVAETGDMYASVDQAIDKLQRQLTRYKEILKEEPRRHFPEPEAEEESQSGPTIIRMEPELRKPMDPQEAVLELESSGKSFIAFYNREEGDVPSVLFHLGNGRYGLIVMKP
ncbi:MAG TPA: ribosome-associated translation inhibitor RaiA [Candidatus Acetothermia bacterium]|nr:ribosome-associated translation inhibitor RaiA [Candidatus Bipolaricaulota bacterium]HDI11374.1 ribosome-associated translation inhibitor RaiA [Candidatus Acetothermia bacterium]